MNFEELGLVELSLAELLVELNKYDKSAKIVTVGNVNYVYTVDYDADTNIIYLNKELQ